MKKAEKFGLEVPQSIKRALEIDKETGTDFWHRAIAKLHVRPAFHILQKGVQAPIGSKWIPCHMIFDIKMDFTHKARFVAGGTHLRLSLIQALWCMTVFVLPSLLLH